MFGQKGVEDGSQYGHGQDSIDCLTNISLYREYVKQGNYKEALPFWRRAFNDCPGATKNIYLDGVKIFKDLHKKELDTEKKNQYVDSLIFVYDQRVKYEFGDEAYINQYKGLDVLQLSNDNVDNLKKVYDYFRISIKGLGKKTIKPVFQNFVKVGISLYDQGEMEVESLLQDYLITLEALEQKGDDNLLNEVNDQMVNSGIISCEQIISIYTPKFEASPEDKKLLITITDFLDKLNCEDSDLYYKALSNRNKVDPTSESAKMLAALAIKKEKYSDAIRYAEKAIELESDKKEKANLYLQLAHATNKNGNKSMARSYARKSIELNPGSGEPYLFIGSLYAESTSECSGLALPKSIYWVAIDMFIKAKQVDPSVSDKANKNIETYSNYYPNQEEAFFHGVKDGESFTVECWINETTTARFNN